MQSEAAQATLERALQDIRQAFIQAVTDGPGGLKPQAAPAAHDDLITNLYVVCASLHRTVEPAAVLATVREILTNLIGAEKFQIFLLDEAREGLVMIADESDRPPKASSIPLRDGIAGVVAKTGIPFLDESRAGEGDYRSPLACVPLKIENRTVGVILVSKLFVQKRVLSLRDQEIFALLAQQAGSALAACSLWRRFAAGRGAKTEPWVNLVLSHIGVGEED